jgi:hypothetical protein
MQEGKGQVDDFSCDLKALAERGPIFPVLQTGGYRQFSRGNWGSEAPEEDTEQCLGVFRR